MPPFLLTQCIRVAMVAEKEGELHRYEALIVNRTLVLTLLRADDQALSLHSIAVQEVQKTGAYVCVALNIFQAPGVQALKNDEGLVRRYLLRPYRGLLQGGGRSTCRCQIPSFRKGVFTFEIGLTS